MLTQARNWRTLFALALIGTVIAGGCGDSCDEEAECGEAPFEGCSYDGCGEISCLADLTIGHVICNEDGSQGCTAWAQQIAEGCETMGTLEQQAGCTQLLEAALGNDTPSQNIVPCMEAMLEIAPCLLDDESGPCPTEGLDAVCFAMPLECE